MFATVDFPVHIKFNVCNDDESKSETPFRWQIHVESKSKNKMKNKIE